MEKHHEEMVAAYLADLDHKPTFQEKLQDAALAAKITAVTMPKMYKQTAAIAPIALTVPLFSIARCRKGETSLPEINSVWHRPGRGLLRYKGRTLTQSHQTLLLTLANMRAGQVVSRAFDFFPSNILEKMNWSRNKENTGRLRQLLDDLKEGQVRIWKDGEDEALNALRVGFIEAFKPSEKGKWHVRLSEDLLPLFTGHLSHINMPRRAALGREGLGTFLYGFICAESCVIPFTFKEIHAASGSNAKSMGGFGGECKRVLQALVNAEVIQGFKLSRGGFRVYK